MTISFVNPLILVDFLWLQRASVHDEPSPITNIFSQSLRSSFYEGSTALFGTHKLMELKECEDRKKSVI